MNQPPKRSFGFYLWSLLTVAVGVVLIWWGAAVTTEDVGLSVPDWPLCFGRINPEGWWRYPALLLEHGHRWLGATIGVLVLVQYLWAFALEKPRLLEAVGIVLCGLGYFYLVYAGALKVASFFVVVAVVWLIMTWTSNRWSLRRGLTTTALLLVIVQASLGGLRVLKMSDPFGIVHGTLGQIFFCVLVWIAFASSRSRDQFTPLTGARALGARVSTAFLFGGVFAQLVIGAILRHTQRVHLAASDLITTGGVLVPPVSPPDAFVLFLHKYWGVAVAILIFVVARNSRAWVGTTPGLRWVPTALMIMPLIQVVLGVSVILTGKSFWVTNFHVLNGLALLALSFLLLVTAWIRERPAEKQTPEESPVPAGEMVNS